MHKTNIGKHLHGDTHGIAEVDNDEGDDGQPLLLREGCHGGPGASLQLGAYKVNFVIQYWKLS